MPAGVACGSPARAREGWSDVIGRVRIKASLHGAGRYEHRQAARGRLDRLEIPAVGRAVAYERFDFGDDLGFERRLEAPFLAA